MAAIASAQIAGVVGCKAGWIAVILQPDSPARAEAKVFENFMKLAGVLNPDSIIAVDMPIGLPERASKGGRAPDWAAKEFLRPRKGSVFLVPSRPAVYAYEQGYAQVCTVARETSDPESPFDTGLFNFSSHSTTRSDATAGRRAAPPCFRGSS
jgi:predicted RNase H-like nuclease